MPSLNSTEGGKYPTMIPAGHFEHPSISYIDLDLPPAADNDNNDDVEESAASDTGWVGYIEKILYRTLAKI